MIKSGSLRDQELEHYLSISPQFQLGELPTEQPHPETRDLSRLAQEDLGEALRVLKSVDQSALEVLLRNPERLEFLTAKIRNVLQAGNRVYLCGCGATGRLSIALETIWREQWAGTANEDQVRSFMAGGDLALIKSIENFEDVPAFAERQLVGSGFRNGDLLIGCSEGGETPFVIAAVEKALEISRRKPFFLYCNPDSILCRVAERSARVIRNPSIHTLSLETGPMAISGSTRMQATTVLMAAVGFSLLGYNESFEEIRNRIERLVQSWHEMDTGFLAPFVRVEANCYEAGEYVLYETDEDFGISILTDTTERAPTFSLLPFENRNENSKLSWCYLYFPHARNSEKAWTLLLRRKPRTLEWEEIDGIASWERLMGFDFSSGLLEHRKKLSDGRRHHLFRIHRIEEGIRLELDDLRHDLVTEGLDRLSEHLLLKLVLNTHSTLIMGRMGRYEGNVMTWVRPSNYKLIDRTIRYVDMFLKREGIKRTYEEIAALCFEMMDGLEEDQPLVLRVVEKILGRAPGYDSRV